MFLAFTVGMQENVTDPDYDDDDGTDKWVQCDGCRKWYHQYCTIVEWSEHTIFVSEMWFCC